MKCGEAAAVIHKYMTGERSKRVIAKYDAAADHVDSCRCVCCSQALAELNGRPVRSQDTEV